MKISLSWLKELIDLDLSPKDLADKLSLTSIGVKEQTQDYIELDLTFNRGDLLSMRGVAREVAAVTGSKLLFTAPKPSDYHWEGKGLSENPVTIEDKILAPVYCVAKIEGLSVESSSEEWRRKLKDCGIRTVNNVADITNLIMLEYGQPMHAFDASKIKEETLVVRVAKQGEKIVTLDGKERVLDKTDLLIADPENPLGLAGVMGGKDSEISESTKTILLEAAIFDPVANRKTSKRHGLYSEATKRFQHGLTKTNLLRALSAAIKMYESLGGKLTAISLAGDLTDEPKTIKLTQDKANSLIGVEIPAEEIESSLQKLGFTLTPQNPALKEWEVTAPYWRLDINIEEDLIEEIARMYGYEKISPQTLKDEASKKVDQALPRFIYGLKKALADIGLTEVQTYSFYSSKIIENLQLNTNDLIKIANPISSETEYLRVSLWPNLLEATAKNIRNGFKDIAIFEIGKVYLPRLASGKTGSPEEGDLPNETYHLSIILCNGTDNPIAELNQIAQIALKHLRGEEMRLHLGGGQNGKEYFHPTRQTDWLAEIHPRIVNKFGIEQRIAVLEIDLIKQQ